MQLKRKPILLYMYFPYIGSHLGSGLSAASNSARERLHGMRFSPLFSIVPRSHRAQAFQMSRCVSKCGRRRKSHMCCSRKYRKRALFLNRDSNLQNTQLWSCTRSRRRASLAYARHISSVRQGCCWSSSGLGELGKWGLWGKGGAVLRGPQQAD